MYIPEMPVEPKRNDYYYVREDSLNADDHSLAFKSSKYQKVVDAYNKALRQAKDKAIEVQNDQQTGGSIISQMNNGYFHLVKGAIYTLDDSYKVDIIEEDTVEDGGGCFVAGSKQLAVVYKIKDDCGDNFVIKHKSTSGTKYLMVREEGLEQVSEMINRVHGYMEGRYDLTDEDLGTIKYLLCKLQVSKIKE